MNLTQGNITRKLIRFTLPILVIQFLNQAYTLADNIIVARFVNEEALSVLSTVSSALLVAYCLMQGLSGASTILCGNLFGAGESRKLRSTVRVLILFSLFVSLFLVAVCAVGASLIFRLLKVPAQIVPECESLLFIYALSLPPTFVCSACTAALNGMGNSKIPMINSVSSQLLNIVLDVLAVAVWGFGVRGAAWASFFSVVVAMLLNLRQLKLSLDSLPAQDGTSAPAAYSARGCLKQYVPLAVPSILQQSIMSIGSLVLQVLVNKQGVSYINGYTVACTLNGLFLLPVSSCCSGYETFAAQNLGAGKHDRVRDGFLRVLALGVGLCALLTLLTLVFAEPLIGLYLTDKTAASFLFARLYLFLLIPNYFLLLAKYSADGLFKAQMKVYLFTLSSFIALGVRIVLSYALEPQLGLTALAWAATIGNLAAALFDFACLLLQHTPKRRPADS